MKKKTIAFVLAAVVSMTALVGTTLAYFTDTDEATNVFTMGNVDISLDEALVEKDGYEYVSDEEGTRVTENTYENLYPGQVLPKDPTIHNDGTQGAWIRVKIQTTTKELTTIAALGQNEEVLSKAAIEKVVDIQDGWTYAGYEVVEEKDGNKTVNFIYTLDEVLASGEDAVVFENVTINPAVEDQNLGFEISVFAEAIQEPGFTTVTEAFEAYDAE